MSLGPHCVATCRIVSLGDPWLNEPSLHYYWLPWWYWRGSKTYTMTRDSFVFCWRYNVSSAEHDDGEYYLSWRTISLLFDTTKSMRHFVDPQVGKTREGCTVKAFLIRSCEVLYRNWGANEHSYSYKNQLFEICSTNLEDLRNTVSWFLRRATNACVSYRVAYRYRFVRFDRWQCIFGISRASQLADTRNGWTILGQSRVTCIWCHESFFPQRWFVACASVDLFRIARRTSKFFYDWSGQGGPKAFQISFRRVRCSLYSRKSSIWSAHHLLFELSRISFGLFCWNTKRSLSSTARKSL